MEEATCRHHVQPVRRTVSTAAQASPDAWPWETPGYRGAWVSKQGMHVQAAVVMGVLAPPHPYGTDWTVWVHGVCIRDVLLCFSPPQVLLDLLTSRCWLPP